MSVFLSMLFVFIILQRITELIIAKRNEKWMLAKGGIEIEPQQHKWFIVVHSLFFLSIFIEIVITKSTAVPTLFTLWFSLFILTQFLRIWSISSLGKHWNTKIIILPGSTLVKRGPYKYIKHPNYIIVGIELFVIPMMFGAYWTAIIFPFLHLILMSIRIPAEEKALTSLND
ncbi:isoprenylcysteine carboxyl methyltransferase family protein [Oceanobacillus sp. 1P07AA]|uniref:isoprenylcysteine carboxyl methyltransferase family protein n=1 Tax=Oceanobacillus sp. 1P07AA TaxID=3132293 RepID=UPI0039A75C77